MGYKMAVFSWGERCLITSLAFRLQKSSAKDLHWEILSSESTDCNAPNVTWSLARGRKERFLAKDEIILTKIENAARGVFPCYALKVDNCDNEVTEIKVEENSKLFG